VNFPAAARDNLPSRSDLSWLRSFLKVCAVGPFRQAQLA